MKMMTMIKTMKITRITTSLTLVVCLVTIGNGSQIVAQASATAEKSAAPGILTRDEASGILPPKVFYKEQSASIQGRNSSGIRMKSGALLLATLVDTSGYSSSVQETYQAYLIAEVPVMIGGQKLLPGSYGFGFIAGDKMVVMDVGAHELLRVNTHRDTGLKRPTPLQILEESAAPGRYRLYLGRTFVALEPAS
jgi:hypothetical protein